MSSAFRIRAQSLMNPALDAEFGERVLFVPMRAVVNGSPEPDKTRHAVEAVAIFDWRRETVFDARDRADNKGHPRRPDEGPIGVQSRKPVFSFAAPCAPSPMRRGDHIVRICAGSERFEIVRKAGDGAARIEAHVVQLGVANDEAN